MLTKEQLRTLEEIQNTQFDLDAPNTTSLSDKEYKRAIGIMKNALEVSSTSSNNTGLEPDLRTQIIEENPEQAKVWQEKGEITPYEAALDASREFNGTYDKVIQRKQTNPAEMNAMGKAVSKFLGDNFPSVKKTLKKFLNEEIVNGYNTQSAIDEAHRQADLNARSQDVNFKDYTRRYEISSIDRAGKANYREVDLLDKIGFLEAMREGTIRGTAFGALAEGADDKKLREIKSKICESKDIYQDELDFLNRHYDKEREKIVRGYSLLGKVGSAAGMSLGISADILAGSFLGELFGLSKIASGAGVNAYKGLRSIDAGKTLSRAVADVANWGVRSLAGAGITTVANAPYRLYAEYQGRMLNNETELTDSGNLIFKESDEKPATAFFKSLEKLYIMYFTEMGGGEALGAIAKGIGKGAKYAASPVIDNLFKKYPKLESFMLKTSDAFAKRFEEINKLPVIGKSTGWLKSQAHFDGFLEECGEEALEDVLNLVAGTNNEERSLENFAKAIFKTPEEWAVIAGAIIIQGAGLSAANYVIAKNMAKNGKSPEEIKETINSISQNQASEIIDDLIKNDSINVGDDVRLTDVDKRRSIEIRNNIKQKLSDVNVPEEEAQRLAVLTGAIYERYGTKNDESRDVFNKYINNLQIKYNLPVNQVLKGSVHKVLNQPMNNNVENEFGQTQEELAEMFKADIQNIMEENNIEADEFDIEDVRIYGSYTKGKNKDTSDLDVIVQYSGTMKEDAAFNLLHDTELTITDKNGVERIVDINPINRETSGTIDEHIQYMNNLNNAKNYNSFEDFVNEFSEHMEETPEDYEINNLQDVLNDLGITENTPLVVNTPTGTVSVRVSSIEHIVNGGDSTLHNPDKSRYKSINRMLAVLERPEIVISDENGKKKYIKLFKGNNKTKSQIAVVYNDVNGDYVYTTIPVTKHKKYILKEVNSGNVIYKKGQTRENIPAANNIITDNSENFNPDILFQPAYHGTPHRFDNFSLDNIGSGEGAQAHGWGLYFAKNKDVSEDYRKTLSDTNGIGTEIKVDNKTYKKVATNTYRNKDDLSENVDDYLNKALNFIETKGTKKDALKYIQKQIDTNKDAGYFDDAVYYIRIKDALNEIKQAKITKYADDYGQLFKVDVPDTDEMLDEDKELIHQPDKVQRAIEKIYADAMKSNNVELTNAIGITGKEIYRGFSKYFGSDKKASEFLNSYGIKGIKYNGYQDGECYVIFDDKAVDILKTYYQETENAEEQKLIAGFTYQEVLDKITKLAIELDNTDNDAVQDEIMTKINILEDAFEAEVHPEKFTQEQITDIMLNAYYVMNDEKIPEKFVESNKKSARTYNDLVKRHKEKKEREEQKYLGYFLKESELKPVIVVMKEKNASTALHEFSHMFLDLLNEMAKVNPDARVQLEAVNKWLNCTGEYTSAQHEKFANNFVAYLYKGKAPNSKLKQVFENFKEWLKSVYKGVSEIPDFELSEEVEQLFSNIFGSDTFFEESRQAAELLKKVKDTVKKQRLKENKYFDNNELDETQKRHKQVSYEILSVATGKSVKYLKTIFETNSNKKSFIKKREAIENLIEMTDDKIYKSGGMRPEWNEFFHDTGVNYDTQDVGGGAELAQAALRTILNKSYRSENDIVSELDERVADLAYAVDEADKQYKILIREYRKGNKNIAIAAICDWIDGLGKEIRKDYEDRFVYDCAMIDREINLDKCEKAKRAIIKRALEVERQSLLTKDEQYKEVVKEIIKNLNFLNPYDKARLTANILDVPSVDMLMSSLNSILDIAKTMEDVRYRKQLETEIHKELQATKNVKKSGKTVGKYNYRTNKIFEELRELDRLSPEKANDLRLENKRFIDATEKVLDYKEKLINKFLSYKAGGRTFADTDLMKELYDEILKIKLAGKSAKSELELEEKLNNEKDVEELFKILNKKTPAKWTTKLYNECFGNIESTINLIFNKRIKEKYASEILYASTQASTWSYEQKMKVIDGLAKIYNVPKWKWDSISIKYLSEKFTFDEIRRKYDEAGEIIKTRIIPREMTKMDIINAYIQSMNEIGNARLINQFGQETLDMMFDELSVQDVKMAELLMNVVQSNYALINKEYIKRYGIDLPRVSNYFPFTPERMDDVNTYNEYQTQSYSFIKTRSKSEIMAMDFHNPLDIVFSHIENVSKFVFMSESIDRANKLFKNPDIKRAIIYKYGNGGYKTLEQELLNIGNRKQAEVYNGFQKIIDRITSNWCLANVMIKPITGLKQLLSASNYAIDMPYIIWQKGFLNALTNYKETIDYMMNIPYLKARYGSGFSNEALKQEIESSEYATIQSLKNFLTLNIRLGDIGAIIFGGKPYIDYLIKEKGMNEEDAIKQFILSTNRSQQSSEVASLSNLQVNMARSPILKVLTAYRNAQQQYVRLCGDAVISVANGDMTKEQCAKVLFNYGFFQPFIFALATSGSLLRGLLTGDWDDLLDDLKLSIFNLGSDSVAFFGDVYKYFVFKDYIILYLIIVTKFQKKKLNYPIGFILSVLQQVN